MSSTPVDAESADPSEATRAEGGGRPRRVVHMVGNAHIDPVWLWSWPEGYQEARATFWSAIQRMEEYPDFVFTCNQVVLLSWVEESDPALFDAIRKRVADGRWVMTGGWWVEPDCNLPTGESFVRQGLYGQRYLSAKFGVTATVGLNADPFGHNAMLPQILRKLGISAYCFLRPGPHEAELPGQPFWWEAPDGSRVLTYRIPHEYCGPRADIAHHTEKAIAQLPPGASEAMVFYGVGNHGGGPTKANIDSLHKLAETGSLGTVIASSPNAYFEAVSESAQTFPVHRDDLQHHAAGCYSAHSGIKSWMRRSEHALLRAEKWASVAGLGAEFDYPLDELTHAWKQVLFNQFHDTLPGTAIEPAYDDARDQLGEARAIAGRVLNRSLQVLARDVDIPESVESQPVLVFNAHPWRVHTTVEIELGLFPEVALVTDDAGNAVRVQPTRPYATVSDPRRRRLAFEADLPPLGYRLYWLRPSDRRFDPATAPPATPAPVLENDRLRAEVDPRTGGLRSLVLKAIGHDLMVDEARPHVVVADDHTDTWGHRVVSYAGTGEPFRCESVRLIEDGPVRSILRVESRYGASTLTEDLVLGRDADFLEVRLNLDWRERLKVAKLRFPTRLSAASATYEIPYGHLERPTDGAEEPGQCWLDLTGTVADDLPAGLTVINDAKAAYDVSGSDIGITIARSPVYAWHDPRELEADGNFSYQDRGHQAFTYLLVPHTGNWRARDVPRLAAELNQRPVAMAESFHPGRRPSHDTFVRVEPASVIVTVLKRGEDDSRHYVIRAYETNGRPANATIEVPLVGRTIRADFAPFEIKTFVLPIDTEQSVRETDLLEQPTQS